MRRYGGGPALTRDTLVTEHAHSIDRFLRMRLQFFRAAEQLHATAGAMAAINAAPNAAAAAAAAAATMPAAARSTSGARSPPPSSGRR